MYIDNCPELDDFMKWKQVQMLGRVGVLGDLYPIPCMGKAQLKHLNFVLNIQINFFFLQFSTICRLFCIPSIFHIVGCHSILYSQTIHHVNTDYLDEDILQIKYKIISSDPKLALKQFFFHLIYLVCAKLSSKKKTVLN